MAVTKLMNIKSSPHGAGRHLYNSIRYIINPEKTKDGLFVGGNAGNSVNEIYNVMMDTKRNWDKMDGRQGYHFVLSWKPGEVNAEQAYEMIEEFCEEYLGDNYDYVFSLHDDQDHIHGHIVFNSVSRTTGYKYRYEKGDWEKYIQPVTDKICERHGVSRLEYEKDAKVGKSYAEHYAEKEGRYTWGKIIQADIDYIISCSESWKDFLLQMKQIGYTFPRSGVKRGIGEYITFCSPGNHRRRSDSLGPGYNVADIKNRIAKRLVGEKTEEKRTVIVGPRLRHCKMTSYPNGTTLSSFQKKTVKRYICAATYFSRTNPYAVNQAKVRKDLLQLDKLGRDCRYLLRNNIKSEEELNKRSDELKSEERYLRSQRAERTLIEEDEIVTRYIELDQQLALIQDRSDDRFEEIQDEMEELEKKMPKGVTKLIRKSQTASKRLIELREEKRIIKHIKKISNEATELKTTNIIRNRKTERHLEQKAGGDKKWKRR